MVLSNYCMNRKNKIIFGSIGLLLVVIFVLSFIFSNFNNSVFSTSQFAGLLNNKTEELPPKEISLLGRAELSFVGSTSERIQNIKLGMSRIDGAIIKPDQEFSFKKTMGPVLASAGFQEAKSFLNGEVVFGIGGGICQVSTTLFESLVNSGLPITERHNHTFSVSYYTTGLDATVSQYGPDLKFINDTGYDIEIKGYTTEENTAVFEIYGVSDERQVSIGKAVVTNKTNTPLTKYEETTDIKKDGQCHNTPQIGYTAQVIYNVLYKTGINKETIFDSVYKPLGRTCYIYTDPVTGCNSTTLYSPKTGIKCER